MNNAPIDYLLQLPIPRPEPAPSAVRADDDAPVFDNHFRQASAAPARFSESSVNFAQQRPRAHEERSPQRAADANSQTLSESESSAASAAAEDVAAGDKEQEHDETPADESSEVVAVLAAAEQLTNSAGSAAKPNHEPTSAGKNAAPSAAAEASELELELPADSATTKPVRDDTAEHAVALKTAADASDVAGEEHDFKQNGEAKSNNNDSGPHEKATAGDTGEKLSASNRAAAAHAVEQGATPKATRSELAGEEAPKKSDKKSTTRTSAALNDTNSPAGDRAATVARASDGSAASPAAANVLQQLSTSGAGPAASTDSAAKPKDVTPAAKEGLLSPFARLERGNAHGVRGSQRAGQGDGAPHVDPARFVSRVARAVHTAQERGGPLHLRLSPPELGAMRLELSVNQGALTATIETDNSTARQLLLDNLPALRERLAEQNVKIERFDVDVRRDSSGSQQNPGPQDRGTEPRHGRASDRHGAARRETTAQVIDEALPIRRTITNTTINVVA
jgi:flagellar hook-length control protein FliK